MALSVGLPGRLKSTSTPFRYATGPVTILISRGVPGRRWYDLDAYMTYDAGVRLGGKVILHC